MAKLSNNLRWILKECLFLSEFSMAKIPIPPLMLLGKMTGVSNRLLLSWSAYALAARKY